MSIVPSLPFTNDSLTWVFSGPPPDPLNLVDVFPSVGSVLHSVCRVGRLWTPAPVLRSVTSRRIPDPPVVDMGDVGFRSSDRYCHLDGARFVTCPVPESE